MTAPVSLADYRAERAAEPDDDDMPLTLDEAGGFIGELRDRVTALERRLARLERRPR